MGGWEEVLLAHDEKGHNTTDINYEMIDDQTLAYVWNSKWGWGREDMVYKLANAGAKVIMCNSSAYYFDMAYDQNPDEIGLSWSGYSNTKTIYSTDPLNIFKLANLDLNLAPLDISNVASKVSLTATGKTKSILGYTCQEYHVVGTDFESDVWKKNVRLFNRLIVNRFWHYRWLQPTE